MKGVEWRRRPPLAPLLGAVLAVTVLATTACGTTADDSELHLGYVATLTGDFASFGLEMREGIDVALDEVNASGGILDKKVVLESQDDQGKPANGPVIAQKFCDNSSISAVLGFSFSSVALSAAPVLEQCQLPVVAASVTSPQLTGISPYFYRTSFTDKFQGTQMGEYLLDQGIKSVAVMYQQDDYGQGVADAVKQALESGGAKVTSSQAYHLGTYNFDTLLNNAKAGAPQAIFIGGFYTEIAKIARQARSAGSQLPIYASDGALSPNLVGIGEQAVNGLTFYAAFAPNSPAGRAQSFVAAFRKKFNKEPTSWAALAYDAVYAIKEAATAGGGTSREEIDSGLKKVSVEGASGPVSFDDQGDRLGRLVFMRVDNGEFLVLNP
ncbi:MULTISPECIES: ABC transporter substrate-binding protein [unclassified Mycolicibacterium]|jgi:branched-chain amino acid transport system substrate-binding protein|uniref:ABC transporter substrate-binding protein n=1 Tax=unclassified Mycolicibacterium TaxID=2636767 RepID=UPI001F4C130E|nr:ABC transporter substrate-binding protein [Mycolicibacterium sp. YH-1]UNB51581.1 ABC transporter substrate-binding protein [Mycolicibacterium sp. YH-1]